MKLAYLILCHKNAPQVKRLIDRLNTEGAIFILHVSKSSEPGFPEEIRDSLHSYSNIHYCKRADGTHNSFGTVHAAINGLRLLLDKQISFDYAILMSGQDYPIKSNEYIREYFESNKGKDFMLHFPINPPVDSEIYKAQPWYPWWSHQQRYRTERYWDHFEQNGPRYSIPDNLYKGDKYAALKTLIKTLSSGSQRGVKTELGLFWYSVMDVKPKPLSPEIELYGGFAWWMFQKQTAKFIVSFFDSHPDFNAFFEHTLIPDEIYFQTMLMNSELRDNLVSEFPKQSTWDPAYSGIHPIIYKVSDFDKLEKSDKLFARKFDNQVDAEVLDLIDQKLL